MKTVLRFFMTTAAGLAAFAGFAHADTGSMHSVNGHLRTRFEYQDNTTLTDSKAFEQFLNRARLNVDITPIDTLKIRITPEAIHNWGSLDATTANNGTVVQPAGAGTNNRPTFGAYEAWMAWMPMDMVSVFVGRQALSYGNGRVIGTDDWFQLVNTFDAARLVVNHDFGQSDFFWAKLNEREGGNGALTDNNLFLLYNAFDLSDRTEFLSDLDLHVGYNYDTNAGGTAGARTKLFLVGARAAGDFELIFYELEVAGQFGERGNVDSQSGLMADATIGANFMERHTVKGNFTYANDEYFNVFGDVHPYLGNADVITRNNVIALSGQGDFGLTDEFSAGLGFYYFLKASKSKATLTNVAIAGSNDSSLGFEFDLELGYQPEEMLRFDLGYSLFKASGSLENAAGDKTYSELYLQGTMSF